MEKLTITADLAGTRIDKILSTLHPQFPRSQWAKVPMTTADERVLKPSYKPKEGEVIRFEHPVPKTLNPNIPAWDAPLTVLADSTTWAVVHKPEGISTHPSPSEGSDKTLLNLLVHHFRENLAEANDKIDGVDIPRPGLVHRLDKPTSGLLLIAKTDDTLRYFQQKWSEVEKHYKAIVHGIISPTGSITAAIGRDPRARTRMAVTTDGKHARTHFTRVLKDDGMSHVDVQLETGRTHQIRVHMASIGHPVMGDTTYGKTDKADRMMLHAHTLVFPNPDENGQMIKVVDENYWGNEAAV